MPFIGHHRTSSLGRSVKRQVIRRLSSSSSRSTAQTEQHVPQLLPLMESRTFDMNTSAHTEPLLQPGAIFTPFSRNPELSSVTKIPQAPPLPATFTEKLSSETLKSTEFTKGIKSRTSSITPSGEENMSKAVVACPEGRDHHVTLLIPDFSTDAPTGLPRARNDRLTFCLTRHRSVSINAHSS